jgi:ubiquinone/menaquinone biosynthesis C-methylase UbiE
MASTSSDTYQFKSEDERKHAVVSMRSYLENKQEQIKFFEQQLEPYLSDSAQLKILDACCGIGDLTYFLSRMSPRSTFVGIDRAEFLLEEARQNLQHNPNATFRELDVRSLTTNFPAKHFDITVCKQTLSWLPEYAEVVEEMMAVTKQAIFISSLFYDGRIDFNIRVREYVTENGKHDYNAFYNVYSFPVFRDFCLSRGAKEVTGFNFDINIDLPRPDNLDRMGTFTERLESGKRLQISGALLMPWKIVRIDLE